MRAFIICITALLFAASPAVAGNSLIEANGQVRVANSALTVTPTRAWNKLGVRPGPSTETWTLDGEALNDLTFYGGIEDNKPIFREADRRNHPLPKFSSTMLLADIPTLLESSYRAGRSVAVFQVERVEPEQFAGRSGVHFGYSFTAPDGVHRRGEAHGAIIDGHLYLITFEAPVIHYFDTSIEAFRQVVGSATIGRAR
jgi:hypothetical protein